ncbi:uncharacterized protein PpBr36_09446 [Pyricularia pennisetigena]|uniref:uncharacterized protein n=1 Tax=Pyricularia pennisetigena TaxID=1578925 RepID=UPI001150BC4D|nr:uncharacterized protein PpBr36_09446 [Pyricularia pennisetigena]TLS21627.1 hypothetical protein PpBr36_09446 [Pyricularia pennisetigena]
MTGAPGPAMPEPRLVPNETRQELVQSLPRTLTSSASSSSSPLYIVDPSKHTMNGSLFDYVAQKVHQDIRNRLDWSEIIVRGAYSRTGHSRPSDCEKVSKTFNWQRPTATILKSVAEGDDENVIALDCFPGGDYMLHYASLVATYLALVGRDPGVLSLSRPPKASLCARLLESSNLRDLGPADVVLVGYVDRLDWTQGREWVRRRQGDLETREHDAAVAGEVHDLFAWQRRTLDSGLTAVYLACKVTFWGDIAGHLVRALRRYSNMKCLLYLGKAGSLRPEVEPNEILVSGNKSILSRGGGDDGEVVVVEWDNALGPELADPEMTTGQSAVVLRGDIISIPSPLCETQDWLERQRQVADWVDCEVGHMALACREAEAQFGYLHLISDNVGRARSENLASEWMGSVKLKRSFLLARMERIIESFLSRYNKETTI